MITEDEIIAKYVKERHSEILNTTDFSLFNLQERLADMFNEIRKPVDDMMERLNKAFGGIKNEDS